MKRLLLLTLSVISSLIMMAGNVTPEQAREQAAQFMTNHVATSKNAPLSPSQLKMAKPIQLEGLYLVNLEDNNGFVIVSNDDRTDAILGYSDTGRLDPENMPDNMRAWLQGYADQIKWIDEHGITSKALRRSPAKTPIAPLVQTHWDQDAPYNGKVNTTDYFVFEGAVTGCVATAMAQVMYYTAKKAGLSTSSTLTATESYTTSFGKAIPVVPAGTTLNWDQMLTEYTYSYNDETRRYDKPNFPEAQGDAVATLMQACGAAVHMNYANTASGGSTASSGQVPGALIKYFGYEDATVQYVDRSFYTYVNWINMIYNELLQGRPVFYSGQSSGGGHAFICDGYQGEDYFHINWGWGGTSDSYFKLSVLNPYEQGIGGSSSSDGYNFGQGAVVGIQLEGGTGTVSNNPSTIDLALNNVTAAKTTMTTDETVNITFNITNNSSDDYDGEIGLFYLNASSNKVGNGKMFSIPAGATQDCVVEFKPKGTGTYRITAHRPQGEGIYVTINNSKYVDITVSEGSGSGSGSELPTTDNLDLTTSLKTLENANDGKTEVYANSRERNIRAVVTVTNPSTTANYKGSFRVYLRIPDISGWYYWSGNAITIPAGGSYDFVFEYPTGDTNFGRTYQLKTCYVKDSEFTSEVNVGGTFKIEKGIFSYSADGTKTVTKATGSYTTPENALYVDLSGTNTTTVTKNSNPNCLYIFKSEDVVPTSLTANVITDDGSSYTAEAITLSDGFDFYAPVDFTASNIEFTFSNDRWADGAAGWNTIILPFNVTQVTANGTPIDWFHSSTDKGKQFWLKEFTSDRVGEVNFSFANTMKANTPYIIALPGNHWGTAYDLSSKTIKFIGSGIINKSMQATITGDNYRFIGLTRTVTTENFYSLNTAGNKFELKASGSSAPFRSFFKADVFDRSVGSLSIGNGGGTTGIEAIEWPQIIQSDKAFDLNGRQITKPVKGIVIMNGRKVVSK